MVDISNPDWSVTDGSNTQAPPNGWPVGMASNQVRPTAQAMMGGIKRLWERSGPAITTTGSAGAYIYTPTNTSYPTALVDGDIYAAIANFTSVGSDTLNINSLGALKLYRPSTAGPVVISAGDIVSGQAFACAYDSTLNSSAGGFHVIYGINFSGSPTQHSQIFTSSGTFTVPSNANSSTVFKITAIGGGGGGGGIPSGTIQGANGGGSGGVGVGWFSGFSADANVTITIGAGGSAGTSAGSAGGNGGSTTVVYNLATIISSSGGTGGLGSAATVTATGARGSSTISASTSGLTLISSTNLGAESGGRGNFAQAATFLNAGCGGGNPFGSGGFGPNTQQGNGNAGVNGSGGGGAFGGTFSNVGGAGGAGFVLVEWVL